MQDVATESSENDVSTSASHESSNRRTRLIRWSAGIAVIGCCVLLLRQAQVRHQLALEESSLQLADLMRIREWALDWIVTNLKTCIGFGLFGFLMAVAMGNPATPLRLSVRLARFLFASLVCLGFLGLLVMIETGRLPSSVDGTVALGGYWFGIWIGRTAWRGPQALVRLLPTFALLALLPLTAALAVGVLSVDSKPFAFEPRQVTADEKRQLTEILTKPQVSHDGSRRLRLSEDEINQMLAMAVTQVFPAAKGRVETGLDSVVTDVSIPVGRSGSSPGYMNVHMEWLVAMNGDRPTARLERCRVGKLAIPALILSLAMTHAQQIVANDMDLKRIMNSIGSLQVKPGAAEVVMKSKDIVKEVLPSLLARLGRNPNITSKVRVYYSHLVDQAKDMPKEERFERLVASAFQLAGERSKHEDPTLENRAAVLALAILLGHPQVEHLVGPVTDPELRREARRHARGVTLRGRTDWCQHFFVSAALALTSNPVLADAAGLLKEGADSAKGGSGFSFCDLTADRAGTRFALAATRDNQAARQMQRRFADGLQIEDVFPEAADLPEGISDDRLKSEYGGVGGEKYEATIAEIERRLETCEALR